MKRFLLTTALCVAASAAMADDGLPRGWQGAFEMYECDPDFWTAKRGKSGDVLYWNNPTCISISGGGQPETPAVAEPPPGDDDEEEPKPPKPPHKPKPPKKERPGWGWGDKNHEHSGPPGKNK